VVHRPTISVYSLLPNLVWVLRHLGRDRCPTWRRHLSNLAAAPVQVGRDARPTWTIPLSKSGPFNHQAGRAVYICYVALTIQAMRNKPGMGESLFFALENEWQSRSPTAPRGTRLPAFRGLLRKDAPSEPPCLRPRPHSAGSIQCVHEKAGIVASSIPCVRGPAFGKPPGGRAGSGARISGSRMIRASYSKKDESFR
jgi:hypothetical protein